MEKSPIDKHFGEEWNTHFFKTMLQYPICWDTFSKNQNITMKTITDNIDHPWNLEEISSNCNITIEFLRKYENKTINARKLDWILMSKNTGLTLEILLAFPNKNWNWHAMSKNYKLTIEWLIAFPDKPWNWNEITRSRNITIGHIQQHPNFPWITKDFCWNKTITLELALENHIKWNWTAREWGILCTNENLPIETILEKQNMLVFDGYGKSVSPWNWVWMGRNKHLTMEIMQKNSNIKWGWCDITSNSNIGLNDVLDYPDCPWDLEFLCMKDGIDMDFIMSHPPEFFKNRISGEPWHVGHISYSHGTVENIKKYPDYSWDFAEISESHLFTIEHIIEFPDKPWHWLNISKSYNLTLEMLHKFPNKPWNWENVFGNDFFDDEFYFVEQRHSSFLLTTFYDFYQNPLLYTGDYTGFAISAEYVFCNDYLVQMVAKY